MGENQYNKKCPSVHDRNSIHDMKSIHDINSIYDMKSFHPDKNFEDKTVLNRRISLQDHVYESVETETESHMRTLDVRIKVTEEVIRESGDFETKDHSLYDRVTLTHRDTTPRNRDRDSLCSTSSHSGDSLHHNNETHMDSWDHDHQSSSMFGRAKVFQQKLTRKCFNKVSSLSLFR